MISNSVLQPNLNLKKSPWFVFIIKSRIQISIFFNSDWLSNRATKIYHAHSGKGSLYLVELGHILNSLFTKFVWSKWLSTEILPSFFFCTFVSLDFISGL